MKQSEKNKKKEESPLSLQEIGERNEPGANEVWQLRLYVAGQTPRSVAAFANLKRICEEHFAGRFGAEEIAHGERREVGAVGNEAGGEFVAGEQTLDDVVVAR